MQMLTLARPSYHFTPPTMWLNDPNGLVYYQGVYHLFYQYHPHTMVWGPMHWGHAVSRDLLRWEHLPIALYPDEHGQIFSGCALVDWRGDAGFGREALLAVFTHHNSAEHRQSQSLAYSTDGGLTWAKYAGNPVLGPPAGVRDFRDPKVFWYGGADDGHWVMCVVAGLCVMFYTSQNLRDWAHSGTFGLGQVAGKDVWETPDLFELPLDGGPATRWVLSIGVGDGGPVGGSGSRYFIGDFDGYSFRSDDLGEPARWADFGADFYAAQSWSDLPDGRRIWIGWMNNWQYARDIPASDWRGMMSLPRELSLRTTAAGPRLAQAPIAELAGLRGPGWRWGELRVEPGDRQLAEITGTALELRAVFRADGAAERFGLRVLAGDTVGTLVSYTPATQRLAVDRTRSGETAFSPRFAAVHSAELAPGDGLVRLDLFIDGASVEVFGGGGLVCISDLLFPGAEGVGIELFAEGGAADLVSLEVYPLGEAPGPRA